jgi:hypothetical protein
MNYYKDKEICLSQLINSVTAVQIFREDDVCIYQIENPQYPYQVFIEVGLEDLGHFGVFSKKYVDLLGVKPKLTEKERDEFKQFTLGKASKELTDDDYHLELAYRLAVHFKETDSTCDSSKALNKLCFSDNNHIYVTKLKVQSILDNMNCNLPLVVLKNILAECGLVHPNETELWYGNKVCLKTWCLTSKMFSLTSRMFPLTSKAELLDFLKQGVVIC